MDPTVPVSKLQKVADYRALHGTLRLSAAWSLLFGAIAVAGGWLWAPPDWVLAVLGLVLLGTGAWNMAAARPTGVILDGVALLFVGAYNLLGVLFALMDGANAYSRWAILGALQLVWGAQRIRTFPRFAASFLEKPSDAEIQQIEQTIGALRGAKTKDSADIVEFRTGGLRPRLWKGRLAAEAAFFVAGSDLLVGTRPTVQLITRGKALPGGPLEAHLAVGRTRLEGRISAESLRRLEQWKAGSVPGPAVRSSADPAARAPATAKAA